MRKNICIFVMTLLIVSSIQVVMGSFNEKEEYIDNNQNFENTDGCTIDLRVNDSYINGIKVDDLEFGNWTYHVELDDIPFEEPWPWYIIIRDKPIFPYETLLLKYIPTPLHSLMAPGITDDCENLLEITNGNFECSQNLEIKINGENAGNLQSELSCRQLDEYYFQSTITFNVDGWIPEPFSIEDILDDETEFENYWEITQKGAGEIGGDYYLSVKLGSITGSATEYTVTGERTINYQTTNQLPFDEIVNFELIDYYSFESNGTSITKYNAYIEQDDDFNLEIVGISGGFGLTFTIQNNGETESEEEDWYLRVTGPIVLIGANQEGTIPSIGPGDTQTVTSGLILGLGKIGIEVKMDDLEWAVIEGGLLLGPIIVGV